MTDINTFQNNQDISIIPKDDAMTNADTVLTSEIWDMDLWQKMQMIYKEEGFAGLKRFYPMFIDSGFTKYKESQIYVDKTDILLRIGFLRNIFLARPRRMGKTTTVSTLAAMCRETYLQSVAAEYTLPRIFESTSFANASSDEKANFCAPYVIRMSFTEAYFNLNLLKDQYQFQSDFLKKEATLNASKQEELKAIENANTSELSAIKENQQKELTALKDSQQKEVSALKDSLQKEITALKDAQQKEVTTLKNAQQQELAALKDAQQKEVTTLKNAQQQELNTLKDAQQQEITALKDAQQQEINTLKDAQQKEITALKDAQQKEVTTLKENLQQELTALKKIQQKELTCLRNAQSKDIEALKATKDEELSALDKIYNAELSIIKSETNKITQQYQANLQKINHNYQAKVNQLEQLKQQYLSSLDSSNLEEYFKLSLTIEQQYTSSLNFANANHKSLSEVAQSSYDGDRTLLQKRLDDLTSIYNKQFQSILTKYDISAINAQHEKEYDHLNARHNSIIEDTKTKYTQKIQSVELKHSQEIQSVESKHSQAIQSVESKHSQEVKSVESKHSQAIQSVESKNSQEIQSIESKHAQEVQSIESKHSQEVKSVESKHSQEVQSVESKCAQEVQSVESKCAQEIQSVELKYPQEVQSIESKHSQEVQSVESKYAQKVQSVESKYAQKVNDIEENYRLKLKTLKSNYNFTVNTEPAKHKSNYDEFLNKSIPLYIDKFINELQIIATQQGLNFEPLNSNNIQYKSEEPETDFINFRFTYVFVKSIIDALIRNISDMHKIQRFDLESQTYGYLEKIINAVGWKLQSTQTDLISHILNSVLSILPPSSVILLIDEYDTPITGTFEFDSLCNTVMKCMRSFYTIVKECSSTIKLCFVTGITNYSKVSLFSGANQFKNISYDQNFATIVGFTEDELKKYLSPAIYRMAILSNCSPQACLNKIKEYYNGYCFALTKSSYIDYRSISIMNPISIGYYLLESRADFKNYWIDTGSNASKYIQTLLRDFDFDDLVEVIDLANKHQLSVESDSFENPQILSLEKIKTSLPIFLFQSGYLTLDWDKNLSLDQHKFYFKIPNQEVKNSFSRSIISLCNFSYIDVFDCFNQAVFNSLFLRRIFLIDVLFQHDENKIAEAMFKFFVEAVGFDARQDTNEAVWRDFLYQALLRDQDLKLLKNLDIEIEREQINGEGLADIVVTHKELKRRVALELKLNKRGSNIDEIIDNAKAQMLSRCYGVGNTYELDCYVCVFSFNKSRGAKDKPSLSITCAKVAENDFKWSMGVTNINNTPTLVTERLILRRFEANELEELLQIHKDPEVNKFLPWFPLKNLDDAAEFYNKHYANLYAQDRGYAYAICLKKHNNPIGYINVSLSDSHDLGYGLCKGFWNQGIITEAALAVIEKVKQDGLPYITATHDRNNPSSGRVMQKIGMNYCYSYEEQWQPKNIPVIFRMYQLNFTAPKDFVYKEYWDKNPNHFVERLN